jgi:hypothetical protein
MPKMRMVVEAGPRARHNVPLKVAIPRCTSARLAEEATGRPVPCQVTHDELHWVLDHLLQGAEKAYVVEPGRGGQGTVPGVAAARVGETVEFSIDGNLFTRYNFGKEWARPFFYPLLGPDQVQITRDYPMVPDVPGESTDHPHHKSLWVAHGSVNEVDDWSEEKGHGTQVSRKIKELVEGPVVAVLRQDLDWVSNRGKTVCEEEREIRVYAAVPEERILDLAVTFRARPGKVVFGDTKEGGLCSIRVATSMDGNKGGRIENSYGAIAEAETWGRRACWCDYSGPVVGKMVGIAVFDTPGNLRYPTYWHVRDYGLMTANPFGISFFQPDSAERGEYTLPAGKELRFAYRVFMHLGTAGVARVADKYHDYINPPRVRLER